MLFLWSYVKSVVVAICVAAVLPKFKVNINTPSFYFVNVKNKELQEDLVLGVTAT